MGELLDDLVAQQEEHFAQAEKFESGPPREFVESILDAAWAQADAQDRSESAGSRERSSENGRSPDAALVGTAKPSTTRNRTLLIVLLATAAAIVLVLNFPREEIADSGPTEILLGDTTLELVRPQSTEDQWDLIEWSGPSEASYIVDILDPADDSVLAGPHRTSETSWRPEFHIDPSGLPETLLIRIEVARSGEPASTPIERLARRPR